MTMGSSISPISAHRGGHEQQREDAGQEQADLFHIVQLDEAQQQGSQQQDQAVDAGRDGQRQNSVAELAQKTERKDACELKQILRKKSPFIAPAQPPLRGSSAGEWASGRAGRSNEARKTPGRAFICDGQCNSIAQKPRRRNGNTC